MNLATNYDNSLSKWYNTHNKSTFRLALCFLSNDGNLQSMPLSSISAYIKNIRSDIAIKMFIMFATEKNPKYFPDGFSSFLSKWEPDLIAISIMTPQWRFIQPYLLSIKQHLPKIPILVGGYHPMFDSENTWKHPSIDFLCNGDGEIPTLNLIQFLKGEIKGPVQGMQEKLNDGSIFCTPPVQIIDYSNLPLPDYSLYDYDGIFHIYSVYYRSKKIIFPAITGRGCPYQCTYCSNSSVYKQWKNKKKYIRKYPMDKVIEQLIFLKNKYNIEFIEFWDELFFNNLPYSIDFLKLYKKHINLPFSCTSRVEIMTDEVCRQAAEANCFNIYFGIESGDETFRKKMLNRHMTNQQIIDAAENCKNNGINRTIFNLIGMPGENKDNIQKTLELTEIIKPEYMHCYIWEPLPNTKLYDYAKKHNLLLENIYNIHFEHIRFSDDFCLNIKEGRYPNGISNKEFKKIGLIFKQLQKKYNKI